MHGGGGSYGFDDRGRLGNGRFFPSFNQGIHGPGRAAIGIQQTVPGLGGFLFLTPQKSVGSNAAFRFLCFDRGVTLTITPEFSLGGLFNRGTPGHFGNFPMSVGSPFRNHVGFVPSEGTNAREGLFKVTVGVNAEDIDIRGFGFDPMNFHGIQTGRDGGRGVMRIVGMGVGCDFLNGIPNFDIGIKQIYFVPDSPTQQGGVRFEAINHRGKM